jgi:hypothetical protein
VSSVVFVVPRRANLTESDARELLRRLETVDSDRGAMNAVSRIRFALSDGQEQTLTAIEAASVHNAVRSWLTEGAEFDRQLRDRLERLERATARV